MVWPQHFRGWTHVYFPVFQARELCLGGTYIDNTWSIRSLSFNIFLLFHHDPDVQGQELPLNAWNFETCSESLNICYLEFSLTKPIFCCLSTLSLALGCDSRLLLQHLLCDSFSEGPLKDLRGIHFWAASLSFEGSHKIVFFYLTGKGMNFSTWGQCVSSEQISFLVLGRTGGNRLVIGKNQCIVYCGSVA